MVRKTPRYKSSPAPEESLVFPETVNRINTPNAGFTEAKNERERRDKEEKERILKEGNERRERLNGAANTILSCLDESSARDIRTAAKDYKIKDIGLYILGLINRLVKTVDIYEPDIEKEWETGQVGWNKVLICKYCNTEISSPKNMGQLYCSNRCARRDREFAKTGILFPSDSNPVLSDKDVDEKKWEQEQKRMGVI